MVYSILVTRIITNKEMDMQRYSRQRESIIEYLRSTHEHPTAETVYKHIRVQLPRISLGTVYRNLSQLAAAGEIIRFSSIDGVDHFDADTANHYHFICNSCGRIQDVTMDPLNDFNRLAGIGIKGRIDGHPVTFYGHCSDCLGTEKEQ